MLSNNSSKEFVLSTLKKIGMEQAKNIQENSEEMTGTELNAESDYVPEFLKAKEKKNMLNRKIGFVCKSSAGRIVKLIQNYDSDIYTDEPETLPAQWGFVWSTDPKKALPFIALSTSPYNKNDCCTYEGHVWKSIQDTNVFEPGAVGAGWDNLGTIEEVIG